MREFLTSWIKSQIVSIFKIKVKKVHKQDLPFTKKQAPYLGNLETKQLINVAIFESVFIMMINQMLKLTIDTIEL